VSIGLADIRRFGRLLFQNRAWTPIPLALWMIRNARPRPVGVAVGAIFVLLGLATRLWAVAHIGSVSRTRRPDIPSVRISSGPYRYLQHPIYAGNGVLSEGLVIANGAGFPWLQIFFPLLWLFQYGPIMLWESALLRTTLAIRDEADADASTPPAEWRAALRSETRTYQAVAAFIGATIYAGLRRGTLKRRKRDARIRFRR